jgi:hypothetical protein
MIKVTHFYLDNTCDLSENLRFFMMSLNLFYRDLFNNINLLNIIIIIILIYF